MQTNKTEWNDLYNATLLTLAATEYKDSRLTTEERKTKENEREKRKEQLRISKMVQQGKCPYCEHKLIRGKKDKHNNYVRTWTCSKCDSKFSR